MKKYRIILTLLLLGLLLWFFTKLHDHSIRTYNGIVTKDETCKDPLPNIISQFKFNGEFVFAIYDKKLNEISNTGKNVIVTKSKSTIPANKFGTHKKIKGTFISLTSEQFKIGYTSKDNPVIHSLRGTRGCIPKFYSDTQGNVLKNEKNEIVCDLAANWPGSVNPKIYFFKIGPNSYKQLNDTYKVDPYLQGGIDLFSSDMDIFDDSGFLFTIDDK